MSGISLLIDSAKAQMYISVSSHESFCEHHLSFAHHIESCNKAYAYKPRLNNKDRKREDINNSNGKGIRYESQQEEGI